MSSKIEVGLSPVKSFLQYLFDNCANGLEFLDREGIRDTPRRIVSAWKEALSGYYLKPEDLLKTSFSEDFGNYDQIILLKNIEFVSTCEHHFLPFYGKVHVGYLPNGKVLGISKIARLVECFARRLQIQERITEQIKVQLDKALKPRGVGVIIEAKHFCVTSRGIKKQKAKMVTSAFSGIFLEENSIRNEFLNLVKK